MNKNKKIMIYLTIGALAFAFVSIFMGFAGGWSNGIWEVETGKWVADPVTIKFFDIIFNKDNIVVDGFGGKTSAALIVTFVLSILSIMALGSLVVLNFKNKSSKKLNKGLMITLAVVLLVLALLMVLSKGVCGVPDENAIVGSPTVIKNKLAAGPICWAVFDLVSGVAMIIAAVQNKKAWAQA